jgi:septal ring factor EnvC (AmiA/AmiB activator)
LISGLEVAIAKQAEEARLAEEKRRAEEARKAEAARIAAQERERALERQREEARRAEQAARAAAAKAQRERDQQEAEKARLQVESALARARAAERAVDEERKRNEEAEQAAKVVRGSVPGMGTEQSGTQPPKVGTDGPAAGTALARAAPPGGFTGLHRGLPYPVSGEVLGRFGAERPEGGLWRGIVLRSPEGTRVQAVAAGRVVYANWLSGFGNIMIVDHGAKYLSVYAYNQSLLKRVGDIVAAGDTIATVGATGGQVDSGLYFEIRHQGTPVNPLLWLRR